MQKTYINFVKHRMNILTMLFAILMASPNSLASFITIHSDISTKVETKKIIVTIKIHNNGNKSAYNMNLDAVFKNQKISFLIAEELKPGKMSEQKIVLPFKEEFLRIIIPLTINYQDVEKRAFSILSYADAKNSMLKKPTIYSKIPSFSIAEEKNIPLIIKSLDEIEHQITARIIIPKEFSISPMLQKVSIPSKGVVRLPFKINNFSAIPRSNYFILGIISEKREHNMLYEDIVPGRINVISHQNIFNLFTRKELNIILGLLILLYLFSQFFTKQNSKNV